MGKFSGYLICTDCDGTLTYEPGKVSDKNAEAIKYFQSEGGLFTLATGRFPDHVELFKDKIQINAPMVSLNGTLLYDTIRGQSIKTWEIGMDKCFEMLDFVQKRFPEIEDYCLNGICCDGTFSSGGYHAKGHKAGDGSLKNTLYNFAGAMLKMVLVQHEDLTLTVQKVLREHYGSNFKFDTSWANGLEIQSIDSGKGMAVKYLKEHLPYHIHTTIGVGDYENDLSLLQCSDIGYAVDNAIDSVKKSADRITVSNRDNALAAIIEELEKDIK